MTPQLLWYKKTFSLIIFYIIQERTMKFNVIYYQFKEIKRKRKKKENF